MTNTEFQNTNQQSREFWNRTAADWQTQVGTEGDANRRLNSDSAL